MSISATLERVISQRQLDVAAVEREAGVAKDTLRNIIRGVSRDPGVLKVYRLANYLGLRIEEVIGEASIGTSLTELPICFKTGGGAWIETDDYRQDHLGVHNGTIVQKYARFKQWYEILEGDSMNELLPNGAYLHVVDTRDMGGYLPKESDIVIVERTRDAGFLRERSAKQVHYENGTLELWPRSTSPRWQKPIIINEHPDDETVSVEIVGLVARAVIDFAT